MSIPPRLRRAGVRVLVLAIVTAALAFTARGVSLADVSHTLVRASRERVVLLVPLLLSAGVLLRAWRFGAVLGEAPGALTGARFRDAVGSVLVVQAANNVLPLHAGDLVRTRDFVRMGYPLAAVALAQLGEKLVEGVTLAAWALPLLVGDFGHRGLLRALALGLVVVASLLVLARAWLRRSALVAPWLTRLAAALPRGHHARAFAYAFAADAVEVALVWVCLEAVGISSGATLAIAVFAAINVAILVPSTPGNLGTQEAGASLMLLAEGIPRDAAVSFAVLYRFVQWAPVTLAGGVVWLGRDRLTAVEKA